MTRIAPAAAFLALAAASASAESHGLGAHEHGHGALNIAIEGATLLMELEVPGADIVGFEHAAKSAEDRAAVDAAVAMLAKPLELFAPTAAANCVVAGASVELIAEDDEHHGHDDEHGHDDHKDEHAHDDHKDEHHDEHAHDDHDEAGESHTEFHAEYTLTCEKPGAIRTIDFAYFAQFPNAEELEIQLISDKGSKGYEVERDAPRLDLAGAI